MRKFIAQISTSRVDRLKVTIEGVLYLVETNKDCEICDMREPENLSPIIVRCLIYKLHERSFPFNSFNL